MDEYRDAARFLKILKASWQNERSEVESSMNTPLIEKAVWVPIAKSWYDNWLEYMKHIDEKEGEVGRDMLYFHNINLKALLVLLPSANQQRNSSRSFLCL